MKVSMRQLIQSLGTFPTVLIVTTFSVVCSVALTSTLCFFEQCEAPRIAVATAIAIPAMVAPLASWPLVDLVMQIDSLEKEMRAMATFDQLTGLLTRQAIFDQIQQVMHLAEREQHHVSLLALDLDRFKDINDTHGHAGGDEVLKSFAITVKAVLRKSDYLGRIGGEEFIIFLPNTSEEAALALSERLHQAIRDSLVAYEQSSIRYSASIGLVSVVPSAEISLEEILKRADDLLYLAKRQGRDCTVSYNDGKPG